MNNSKYFVVAALSILVIAPFALAANDYPVTALTGRWKGSLANGPSVELTVTTRAHQLAGKIAFPMIQNGQVVKREEHDLDGPKFDGKTLSFQIKSDSGATPHRFALKLVGQDHAEMSDGDEADAPLEMSRQR